MIFELRRQHRYTILVLGVAAPSMFLTALALRPSFPSEVPPKLLGQLGYVSEYGKSLPVEELAASLQGSPGQPEVLVSMPRSVLRPDVALYWSPSGENGVDDRAHYIGSLTGGGRRIFSLPPSALGQPGQLLFHSVAHNELVQIVPLLSAGTSSAVGGRP